MNYAEFELHARIEQKHWWFRGRQRIVHDLIRCLTGLKKDALIVDFGCGTGANLAFLARNYRCIGIDPFPKAIELAQSRFPGIRFLAGNSLDDLGCEREQMDWILLMDVLEHVANDAGLLADICQGMKPGSHLLITVPADPSLMSEHDATFGHYRRYERHGFEHLWSGLPLTPLLVSYYNSYLYPLIKMARTINRWRGKTWGENQTDFSIPPRPINALLEAIFVRESKILKGVLRQEQSRGFLRGVSLIAILRRESTSK